MRRTKKDPRYDTKLWRALRETVLREQPICATEGCTRVSKQCDHIIPKRIWCDEQGKDFYDRENLQGLCRECHTEKTSKENTAGGSAWQPGDESMFLYDEDGNPTAAGERFAKRRKETYGRRPSGRKPFPRKSLCYNPR